MKPVFMHGFSGRPEDWSQVRAALPEAVRGEAIDLNQVAHRHEIWSPWFPIHGPSILVGYSMGARLALARCFEDAANITGLVLISGNSGIRNERTRLQRTEADQELANRLLQIGRHSLNDQPALGTFFREWYGQPLFQATPSDLRETLIQTKGHLAPDRLARELLEFSVGRQPNYLTRLKELKFPVLCLAGALDTKYVELARQMAAALPQGQVIELPDCGHMLHLEWPVEVARLMSQFIHKHFKQVFK